MPKQCCKDFYVKIPDDEPIFIIAARDLLASDVVAYWLERAKRDGVSEDKRKRAQEHLRDIIQFQQKFPERCHLPD